MFSSDLFLDAFIALFALLNPLFAIPVFLGLTSDYTAAERQRTAAVAAVTVLIALVVAALLGERILDLFGVHVQSFQIAGGLIVFTIALGLLKGPGVAEGKDAAAQKADAAGNGIAVYPLAIPLLAGPGAFVTTVVLSSRLDSLRDFLALGAALLAIAAVLWLAMAFAGRAARYLHEVAINISTKILGVMLAAVAVEMILRGLDAHILTLLHGAKPQ